MIVLKIVLVFLNLIFIFKSTNSYIVEPGPSVITTKGEVWPKPQKQTKFDKFYILRPQAFEFKVVGENCDLLKNALQRYTDIINGSVIPQSGAKHKQNYYKPWRSYKNFVGYLDTLNVLLSEPCGNNDLPTHTMKEQCCPGGTNIASVFYGINNSRRIVSDVKGFFLQEHILTISDEGKTSALSASSIWGILRGLETFSQLLFPTVEKALQINCTTIYDYPRFSHRGLLVDTSRHFIPMPKLLKTLDAMAYNKMNVFHWHITDDQSFPYESKKYPELSQKGAYSNLHVYSSSDVQKIIRYAGARGIRVVVEFDTPGHTRSWGEAIPQILTPCYKQGVPSGQYGPMDPTKNYTYSFLQDFFEEVISVFPDQYLHLGGDEVEFECWDSNPDIKRFMKEYNISNYKELEDFYIQKLLNIVDNLKGKSIVWEEVYTNGVKIPATTVVHVWKDWGVGWQAIISSATRAGYPVLLSACWYLDHLSTGGDWTKYYECDPYSFPGTEQQKELVIGGEACMWAEVVNEYNIESRIWPRASATAEKLWSAENADTKESAAKRLEEHTCRMNKRGIGAQPPNGAGFCNQE